MKAKSTYIGATLLALGFQSQAFAADTIGEVRCGDELSYDMMSDGTFSYVVSDRSRSGTYRFSGEANLLATYNQIDGDMYISLIDLKTGRSGSVDPMQDGPFSRMAASVVWYPDETCRLVRGTLRDSEGGRGSIADQPGTAQSPYPLALKQPTTFSRGTRLTSPSHYIELQSDGNFVVKTAGGGYIYGMNEVLPNDYQRIARIEFQADGNLAAYDANGQWVWSALNQANNGGQLVLDDVGQLQLLNAQNKVLWMFKR